MTVAHKRQRCEMSIGVCMDKVEKLEGLLNEGLTYMQAREIYPELSFIKPKGFKKTTINEGEFPCDYFSQDREGERIFKFEKISKYKSFPSNGIILKDGTIHAVKSIHMATSIWLKYNGIDLSGNLKYVYFSDTENLQFNVGYDNDKTLAENNLDMLVCKWNEYYENFEKSPNIANISEEQAIAIFYLCKNFELNFDRVLVNNNIFKLDQLSAVTPADFKTCRNNENAVTGAYERIPLIDIYAAR